MKYLRRFAVGCAIGLVIVAVCTMIYFAGSALLIAVATNQKLVVVYFAAVFVLVIGILHSLFGG